MDDWDWSIHTLACGDWPGFGNQVMIGQGENLPLRKKQIIRGLPIKASFVFLPRASLITRHNASHRLSVGRTYATLDTPRICVQ